MLTRREFLAAGTGAAALVVTPSCSPAQIPKGHQAERDAVPPTSPNPVSTRPADNLGGSTVNVGSNPGDLQTAINGALNGDGTHKGNTLVVPAGVTYNPITMPRTSGSGWTCIRSNSGTLPVAGTRVSPSNASAMFKVVSVGQPDRITLQIPAGSNGWRFIGMDATHPNANRAYAVVFADGDRLSFERCYVHGHTGQTFMARCFFVHGSDVQFWDSHLSDAKATDADTQAIFARNNSRMHVENCELQATGENIMLGDQGSSIGCSDVVIRRNHLFKPLTWRRLLHTGAPNPSWDGTLWFVKNLFEIKWASRVLFEGNVLENNWAQGQDGVGWLMNHGVTEDEAKKRINGTDVMARCNILKNTPYGFTISTNKPREVMPSRIAILNNLGLEMGGRCLFLNHGASDVWFEHNTLVPLQGANSETSQGWGPNAAFNLNQDYPGCFPRFTLKRNAFGKAQYGIYIAGGVMSEAFLNQIIPDRSWAENAEWDAIGEPVLSGITRYASPRAAGIDVLTGRLNTGSPLIRAGSDGKDIGCDFAQLAAAQTGVK